MTQQLILLCFAGGLGSLVLFLGGVSANRWRRRRAKRVESRENAADLGLTEANGLLPATLLDGLPLLRRGQGFHLSNCFSGESCGATVYLFDLHYAPDSETPETAQTVVMIQSERLALPEFYVRRKSSTDRWLTPDTNHLVIDPTFAKSWLVDGEDEEAVHALFTPELIALLNQTEFCIEGCGHRLLIYRENERVSGPDSERRLQAAYEFVTLLCLTHESADWQTVPM